MIVCKFGGTSVASEKMAHNIKHIVDQNNNRKIIVVSALGKNNEYDYKITDKLIELCCALKENQTYKNIVDEVFFRYIDISKKLNVKINWQKYKNEFLSSISQGATKDYILSRGEYYSALLYSKFLKFEFLDAKNFIKVNNNSKINENRTKNALKSINLCKNYVIGGFYGQKQNGDICVFDRGGSDITGAIIAKSLNFELYENYTDVNGVFDKNPNIFNGAISLPILSCGTAIKMAECGNEVVHKDALQIIKTSNALLLVKSTINNHNLGTIVVDEYKNESQKLYVCVCCVKIILCKNLNRDNLFKILEYVELLKIITIKDNSYILAKNIYVNKLKITSISGVSEVFEGKVVSFFCDNRFMSKNSMKCVQKLQKKLKKCCIFAKFCSLSNNFNILSSNSDYGVVINKINKYMK